MGFYLTLVGYLIKGILPVFPSHLALCILYQVSKLTLKHLASQWPPIRIKLTCPQITGYMTSFQILVDKWVVLIQT